MRAPVGSSPEGLTGVFNNPGVRARVGISNYRRRIADVYDLSPAGVVDCPESLGLILTFCSLTSFPLYDSLGVLNAEVRRLVRRFGPVVIENILLESIPQVPIITANFSDLDWHIDRHARWADHFTILMRNSSTHDEHIRARTSSTLVVPNDVYALETARARCKGTNSDKIFQTERIKALRGGVFFEYPWDGPGQTALVFDNTTGQHASWWSRGVMGYRLDKVYVE